MFGFTKQEKIVFFFLVIVFIIGTGITAYQRSAFKNSANEYKDKYAQLDSRFNNYSRQDSMQNKIEKSKQALININTADKQELMKLPGIGPALSDRIIQYRKNTGLFKTKRDIINIKGIGDKKFKQIEPLISVEN